MTRTVTVTLTNDSGPVTDATVTLADPTDAYGIVIAGTGEVVVDAGESMPHLGAGVYAYDFTATVGVAYEASVRVQWADGTVDYVDRELDAASDADPTSTAGYGTLADLYAAAGSRDVRLYSNTDQVGLAGDNTLALDADRTQAAMDGTDSEVTQYLRVNGCATPPNVLTDPDLPMIREAWALLTLTRLYRARGSEVDTDDNGQVAYKSNKWAKDARTLLQRFVLGKRAASFSTSIGYARGSRGTPGLGWFPCG